MTGDRIIEAVGAALASWGVQGERVTCERRLWSSVTFSGERLRLVYTLAAPPPADLADRLDALDFDLRGQFVADISAVIEPERLSLELLVIDEASEIS